MNIIYQIIMEFQRILFSIMVGWIDGTENEYPLLLPTQRHRIQ